MTVFRRPAEKFREQFLAPLRARQIEGAAQFGKAACLGGDKAVGGDAVVAQDPAHRILAQMGQDFAEVLRLQLGVVEHFAKIAAAFLDHRRKQFFLGREVIVERGLGAPDLGRDAGHGGRGITVLQKGGMGDPQDGLAAFVAIGAREAGCNGTHYDRTVQFSVDRLFPKEVILSMINDRTVQFI